MPGEVAALICAAGDTLIVYAQMSDGAALREAFTSITAEMPQGSQQSSCAEGQYVGTYPGGGQTPRGLVACWLPPDGGSVLFWTDDANVVIGGILSPDADIGALDATWQEALLAPES